MFDRLKRLAGDPARQEIAALFAHDPERAATFSVTHDGMLFDYSKTRIDAEARAALVDLAESHEVAARRDAMFAGQAINETEGRAVLHTALRNLAGDPVLIEGRDVMPGVLETLARMEDFADAVRGGRFTGQDGAITDVVNIGIGGSHLGPEMATRALSPCHDGPRCHFVSNVDGADIHDTLKGLDPARTLVIVASKSFTTAETMTNAATAREWMAQSVADPAAQFVAVSSALERTGAFGIPPERVFGFEDWVGGRYSLWGPIGLPLMIAIGPADFRAFLGGGADMDAHFRDAPLDVNMPVLLALCGIWHHQVCGYPTRAVLPYDQRLARLPAYLQQLEMESNGKRVTMAGAPLENGSGPVVWGEPGTNGQHAFYQLIHQGTQVVPCEFMLAATGHEPHLAHHQRMLVANCLAQSEALMRGRPMAEAREMMRAAGATGKELERLAAHRVFPGNRPSTTLLYDRLTPRRLGQIIALYEHRVFVEGVVLGINSFDQWGVELGKALASEIEPILAGEADGAEKDGSTRALIAQVKASGG
ncbi:glucose-6-phosphate isomerase [Roseovarius halotolerans]|uniref:Glucose-6-phosphate isomerase n=1 Tax=Roseovarius halotolerans TaxID=505353 RepID=A0A1X6Z8J0_9RHOB|nr:glucose-6-phosphate isomerase [Roseovarius halotolerans]RKT30377.1 glucose-6-phosphate isomerase [Roseovarius halotolerans]SLN43614.1 Glucose-6-phosphate isomerase [Roseovarius halotolerans]